VSHRPTQWQLPARSGAAPLRRAVRILAPALLEDRVRIFLKTSGSASAYFASSAFSALRFCVAESSFASFLTRSSYNGVRAFEEYFGNKNAHSVFASDL
jgi:hypothetical protein